MIWIGVICMVVGAMLAIGAGMANGFDFVARAEDDAREETFEITEAFDEIDIENDAGSIRVERAQDGVCRAVCIQGDNYRYRVFVKDGALQIKGERKGLLSYIGLTSRDVGVCLYLPADSYHEIDIESASGDITVCEGLSFRDVEMKAASGRITFDGAAMDELEAQSASGDICIGGSVNEADLKAASGSVTVTGDVQTAQVSAVSGSVRIASGGVRAVRVSTTSGDITFEGVNAEEITASAVSGTVYFADADARRINIKTTSGNVQGALLTDKIFNIKTTSGDVETPRSVSGGGECDIKTVSGNVDLIVK